MIRIEDLTGDFDIFMADTFNQKPQIRENALPNVASDLIGVKEFDDMVNSEVLKFPYFKINLNGQGVPEQGYTRDIIVQGETQTRVVDPAKVESLYRAGGTLTWASINHYNSKVRDFTRMLSAQMSVRVDAVGFMTPAGKKGYPAHHDGVDLFIIQLSGSKRWRLWNLAEDRRADSASYTEEALGEPVVDRELREGDVLYLPYGTPHQAMALDEPSLHLSIMMRPRMWRNLLSDLVEDIFDRGDYMDYPPLARTYNPEIGASFDAQIDKLVAALQAVSAEQAWVDARKTGQTMTGSSRSDFLRKSVEDVQFGPETPLIRNNKKATFSPMDDGRILLESGGLKFALSSELANKIAAVDEGNRIHVSEIIGDHVDPKRAKTLAQTLVKLGTFHPAAE